MKILFLSCHLPFPPLSGGRRREYELIKRLSVDFEVYLCCITKTYESDAAHIYAAKKYCREVFLFATEDYQKYEVGPYQVLKKCYPEQVLRHMSDSARLAISDLLQTHCFDVIHVEGYYLMHNLPFEIDCPIVLADQNIEYCLYQQRLELADASSRAAYLHQFYRTRVWERHAWQRAQRCVVVTRDDYQHVLNYGADLVVHYVPDGVDHAPSLSDYSCEVVSRQMPGTPCEARLDQPPTLLYVGNFGYSPNIDAATYLVEQIFPLVLEQLPQVRLLLVGNAPPESIRRLARCDQVMVTGLVPSLAPFFQRADLFVCPLRVGGGIKVKILEALYAGLPIVTTSVGAQGFGQDFARAAVIENDPHAFARQVVRLIRDPQARLHLQQEARAFVRRLPTWDGATTELAHCYRALSMAEDVPAA